MPKESPLLLPLSLGLSVPALLSGELLIQSMGLLLLVTAAGFWVHSRICGRPTPEQSPLSQDMPETSVGERFLPVIFSLATILIIAAAAVGTWVNLHAGP
jgi:hypothetical protein